MPAVASVATLWHLDPYTVDTGIRTICGKLLLTSNALKYARAFGLINGQVAGDHLGHQPLGALIDPFHVLFSIANFIDGRRSDRHDVNSMSIEGSVVPQHGSGDAGELIEA